MKYLAHTLVLFLLALAAPAFADSTVTYSYDALGRLVRSVNSGTSNADTSYTIDPAGNRTNVNVNLPTFSIDSVSVTEGGTATLTVTKAGNASGTLSVNYASADGTATAGSDYTATGTQALTFLASETTKTISVATIDDASVEGAETFTVNLSGASSGSAIGQGTGTVTINDNDVPPITFAISPAPAVTEGGTLVYTVTKTGSGAANVSYASASGTATSGSDFNAASGTLVFASGDTSKTISVTTIDDSTIESAETVLMNLSAPTNGATITTAQGSGTINDNDATSFAISNAAAVVEGGNLVYTVTKTGSGAASVSYATADGTATAGSDYTASGTQTLTFLATDTTKTITVPTIDDATVESSETVLVNLSGATGGATIASAQGSGTINDNDGSGDRFSIDDPSITESGHLIFTVSVAAPATTNVGVSYATADGTAVSGAGGDYSSRSGNLTFKPGDVSKTIDVTTTSDTIVEGDEYLYVNLSSPTGGATIVDGQGVGTIIDDDGPANCTGVSFTIAANGAVTEGTNSSFTVTKTGSTSSTCTVDYGTADGTAIAGSDYTAKSSTLSFTSTQTSRTVNIVTADDTIYEPAETFSMTLSNPSAGATLGSPSSVTATINDNDIGIFVSDASALEGSQLTFTVTLSQVPSSQVSVSYATADGTAISGTPRDYSSRSGTLTFKAGDTSKTFSVSSNQDTLVEGNEYFYVNLSAPSAGTSIVDGQGVGTIIDND